MLSFTSVQNDKLYIISQPFGYQYPLFALNFKPISYICTNICLRPYLNEKTVYVILVLCCFIIKTYSINRPYYHFKQLSIKEGLPTSIISLYDDKTVHYGSEPLREYIVSMEKNQEI